MTTAQLQIGDYLIIETLEPTLLGEQAIVQHRFLKDRALLTLFSVELSRDKAFVKRFEEEVSRLAQLTHPHLLALRQASFDEDRFYLVSDLPSGRSLLDRCDYPEEQMERMAKQIADLLDYLHTQGVTAYGSLNLRNLYWDGEIVKLAEVGLGRLIGEASLKTEAHQLLWQKMVYQLAQEQLTRAVLGQTAFLAPEVDPGAEADSYAFGVLLYFLFTGRYPIGLAQTSLPARWNEIILSCLQFEPENRPLWLKPLFNSLEIQKGKPVLKPQQLVRPEHDPDPGAIFHIEPVIAPYTPKKSEGKSIDPLLSEMVVIPQGHYQRGSHQGNRDEMPRHAIYLSSFALDIHPVTNEQFVLFLEAMGGEKDAHNSDIIRLRDSRIKRAAGRLSIESGYAKHPVVGVTWYGAAAYAAWVGKRLPTEAEWEIAACGGQEGISYPTGEEIDRTKANFFSSDTTAVMSYAPNGLGLYDMAGNVYEWCHDWYGYNSYELSVQEPDNPQGPLQGVYRVLRGGCWKSLKEDLRCAHRHRNNPGSMNGTYGFRCAADVVD